MRYNKEEEDLNIGDNSSIKYTYLEVVIENMWIHFYVKIYIRTEKKEEEEKEEEIEEKEEEIKKKRKKYMMFL